MWDGMVNVITGSGYISTCLHEFLEDSITIGRSNCDYLMDLTDSLAVEKCLIDLQPDYVFHLAGVPFSDSWKEYLSGNVETTYAVLNAVEKAKCRAIVIGSAAEYGRLRMPLKESQELLPVSPYGLSMKMRTEASRYFYRRGTDVIIARLFNPIGKHLSERYAIGSFMKQLPSGVIKVGNLGMKRDFIDMEDMCKAFVALAERGHSGEAYNVCSGKSYSYGEIIELMAGESGTLVEIVVDKSRMHGNDIMDVYGSIEKITAHTGWKPEIPIQESVRRLFD